MDAPRTSLNASLPWPEAAHLLIEFAALLWGMGISGAVAQLARRGAPLPAEELAPERVAAYVRDYPDYRRRLRGLWQRARDWLPGPARRC